MQSLLLDRKVGSVTNREFIGTLAETYYSILNQKAIDGVFPPNCHNSASVNSMSLEGENRFLLSGCADSTIKLWDLGQVRKSKTADSTHIKHHDDFDIHDYDNPDSTYETVASVPRKSVHKFGISGIQWWPYDSGMFVSASFDHTVRVWDTNAFAPVHTFDMENRVYSIDTSGSANANGMSATALVAVASDQPFIRLLDLRSTSSAHTLNGHKGKTLVVKWHPQKPNILASGGYDGEIKVWDVRRSKSCLARLDMLRTNTQSLHADNLTSSSVKAHSGPVNGLVWNELGTTLYTAGNDDKVRVWDMVSSMAPPINKLINFGPLTRNKYPQCTPMVLSSSAETELQYLLFPSDNGDVFVFRTVDGKMVTRLSRKGTKKNGRTTAMVSAGLDTGTYYCGTMDGEIVTWTPFWDRPNPRVLIPDRDYDQATGHSGKTQLAAEARAIIDQNSGNF